MADWSRLLQEFEFPHTQRGGVTLVSRADANACVELIYAQGWRFLGYDSFTVVDQAITPHLEWTEDWSRTGAPDKILVLQRIASHPSYVTHYEFVFRGAA